jgi:hypothetical protein
LSHIQLDALSNELFKKCHFGFETVSSRAALPDKDVFGGTPNTARETHALPTHFSAFLKGRGKGGRKISDYSFWGRFARSNSVKLGQTDSVGQTLGKLYANTLI